MANRLSASMFLLVFITNMHYILSTQQFSIEIYLSEGYVLMLRIIGLRVSILAMASIM